MKKHILLGLMILGLVGTLSACETTGYTPSDSGGHGGHSH
ncbi:hypothetical protein TOL_1716 [Thalassolituus oleivorans MIL-1]|jgi:hypothetical protein|uniref:Lipoprotein n=2 Tax=root TaxID=1 RepID=M5DQE3_9GAMM|nr:hypothetical protein TOL_1716 [Thalassolituus oleivorans MIL-1]|tara:strand:- start:925 stop:1044 length:120 start_codon:yes stop_codon:yes gene_type:complete